MKDTEKNELVTVFIPAYNAAEYIGQTIESVLVQTYENLEILIIDDGSTDDTLKIAKSYQNKDKRIRVECNRTNKGIPYTRNYGLSIANGQYFAIADADDISLPNRIEKQVAALQKNPDVAVVYSEMQILGTNKKTHLNFKKKEIRPSLMFYNVITNPSAMMRRNEKLPNYHLDYFVAQDYGIWSEIAQYGEFLMLPEILVHYRMGHGSITERSQGSKEKDSKRNIITSRIHNSLIDFYGFELTQKEKNIFNQYFIDTSGYNKQIDYQLLTKVLKKIIYQNEEKKIFEKSLFIEVVKKVSTIHMEKHADNISELYNIYKQIHFRNNIIFLKLIIKKILKK